MSKHSHSDTEQTFETLYAQLERERAEKKKTNRKIDAFLNVKDICTHECSKCKKLTCWNLHGEVDDENLWLCENCEDVLCRFCAEKCERCDGTNA